MPQTTLLMDIGNVLLRVDLSRLMEMMSACGICPDEEQLRLLNEAATAHEKGQMGTSVFLDRATALMGLKESDRQLALDIWNSIFLPDAPILESWEACRTLKSRGARIVLFSNTNETHLAFMQEHWPDLFALADDAIYSCRINALKPDPVFYERAISRLNLRPETTYYFDDKPENVAGGLLHGFRTHLFDWRKQEESMLRFLPDS